MLHLPKAKNGANLYPYLIAGTWLLVTLPLTFTPTLLLEKGNKGLDLKGHFELDVKIEHASNARVHCRCISSLNNCENCIHNCEGHSFT